MKNKSNKSVTIKEIQRFLDAHGAIIVNENVCAKIANGLQKTK